MDNMILLTTTVEEMQKNIQRLKSKTMKRFGLGISDLACLMSIKHAPGGMTSTELSQHCKVDKALISRSVKKLLEQGVIAYARPRLPLDETAARVEVKTRRRGAYRVKLILTEAGEQITRCFFDVSKAAAKYSMADLTDEQNDAFIRMMTQINEKFSEYMEQIGDELPDQSAE